MQQLELWLKIHSIWLTVIATVAAIIFGVYQIRLNQELVKLQNYVTVAIVPGDGLIKILNTGKRNLYLWGYDILDNQEKFQKPRLLSVGTLDSSFYWIPMPEKLALGEFTLTLYLKDESGTK